jgi:predicted nucleic acid-binding Zn finger protein
MPMREYSVESSKGSTRYKVTEYEDGKWACDCPHFLFRLRKSGTACKHIDLIKKANADYQVELAQIEVEFANIEWKE